MPPRKQPIRVVIADDQALQREGYRMVLEATKGIEVVGEAGDGAQLLAVVRRAAADVVLMDIQMPRVNGLVAAERVLNDAQVRELEGRAPRIILLTAVDVDEHVAAAVAAGVFAVLFKDIEPEALIEAIRSAAAEPAA